MATKRKRRTKHRGTPVGTVESRGRTGRKPTPAEQRGKGAGRSAAAERRASKLDRPPTWRGAANRAAVAALLLLAMLILLFKQEPARAIALAGFALLFYIPMGYYTDLFIYRRRQRAKLNAPEKKG